MKATLTALIHGASGVGKSWLADTAPAPRLVIDLEGRAKYTPSGPKIGWDPRVGPPPVYDGTWQTCVVACADFETLTQVFQWLRSGQHSFVSVIIDSLMEAQKRCIDSAVGTSALDQQDWGTILRKLEALVRSYRDLTLVEANTVAVVLLLVGSRAGMKTGKQEPLLQGQLAETVPYYLDVVGYLFKQQVAAADGVSQVFERALLVDEQPGFVAKDGTGRLKSTYGPVIRMPETVPPTPYIESLFELLKAPNPAHATHALPVAPVAVEPAPVAPAVIEGGVPV